MNIMDIIRTGVSYPTANYRNLLVVGIFFTVIELLGSINEVVSFNSYLLTVSFILSFILSIFIYGYALELIRQGMVDSFRIPLFEFGTFLDGLKVLIVSFVYYLIPFILTLVVGYVSGLFSNLFMILDSVSSFDISVFSGSFLLTFLFAFFVFVVFSFFLQIALCRLAESGSVGDALDFSFVFSKISSIGWFRYIVFLFLICIVFCVFLIIYLFVSIIPYVGFIIGSLIVLPFMFLFVYYSFGLLYGEL